MVSQERLQVGDLLSGKFQGFAGPNSELLRKLHLMLEYKGEMKDAGAVVRPATALALQNAKTSWPPPGSVTNGRSSKPSRQREDVLRQ